MVVQDQDLHCASMFPYSSSESDVQRAHKEILLQQLPPMADLVKICLFFEIFFLRFCSSVELRLIESMFQFMATFSFHNSVNITVLVKITVDSRIGER